MEEISDEKPKIVLPRQGRSVIVGEAVDTFKVTGDGSYCKFGLDETRMEPAEDQSIYRYHKANGTIINDKHITLTRILC